ncbi:MAG: histidine phosphatase family protein [Nitriliruptoraceae bacterium]|nr:histidine phosphatase family protein [Nitriliruptoraceae bacterium]
MLLRHAWAGVRGEDPVADRRRPLDERGRRQAQALPDLLAARGIHPTVLLSSPATRCLDSLAPLAGVLGLPVERDERLLEVAPPLQARDTWAQASWYAARALASLEASAGTDGVCVVCSHGEILPALLGALAATRDLDLRDGPDLTHKAMPKGGAWWVRDGRVEELAAP